MYHLCQIKSAPIIPQLGATLADIRFGLTGFLGHNGRRPQTLLSSEQLRSLVLRACVFWGGLEPPSLGFHKSHAPPSELPEHKTAGLATGSLSHVLPTQNPIVSNEKKTCLELGEAGGLEPPHVRLRTDATPHRQCLPESSERTAGCQRPSGMLRRTDSNRRPTDYKSAALPTAPLHDTFTI